MKPHFAALLSLLLSSVIFAGPQSLVFEPVGAPKGKHIVLVSGDEEYRSEESMPMLAKILSQRHGFKCTVLFALDPDGTINPNNIRSLSDPAALDSADAIILATRWRDYPDDQMKHFVDAYRRGVPIVALRTATHAFKPKSGAYMDFAKFGKNVFGEDWVDHWGRHAYEATRGIVEPDAESSPLLRGVSDIFGPTDVYEVHPPADVKILLRGQVLKGMNPADLPADRRKTRKTDKQEQPVNDPMMPIAWTRLHRNDSGRENKIFCTTMGASADFQNEGLRRLVVNGVYWGLGLDVPAKADVRYVDPFVATKFGFNGHKPGMKPDDYGLGK